MIPDRTAISLKLNITGTSESCKNYAEATCRSSYWIMFGPGEVQYLRQWSLTMLQVFRKVIRSKETQQIPWF